MPDRRATRLRGEGGFSIIELLVAIALMGTVLGGFAGVFISGTRSVGAQRLHTAAIRVAADHLERLRSLSADQLDAQAGRRTVVAPSATTFTVDTTVVRIDAATGAPAGGSAVRQVTATVTWTSRGTTRTVSSTTAVTPPATLGVNASIGAITMFPNPAPVGPVDLLAQLDSPLQDIDVNVPLQGFPTNTLVSLTWDNAGLLAVPGAQTLTSTTGLNWHGVIPKSSIRVALSPDLKGQVTFTVKAGSLVALYTLAVQRQVLIPPAITAATISPSPIVVALPGVGKTCAAANQCQNTTDLVFTVAATGLDQAQDSVIVQFQLYDGSSQELPLTPNGSQWVLTVRSKTTRFLTGTDRAFRFTATHVVNGATASKTVLQPVVAL